MIARLRNDYPAGPTYGSTVLSIDTPDAVYNRDFMGSENLVFITCQDAIVHEAPACIAAPRVVMAAKNAIKLGMEGQGAHPFPVRLHVPQKLLLTAKQLCVGDLSLVVEPKRGFVSCQKLLLSKSTEEEPPHFEIVKSWVVNDDVEIAIMRH